MVDRSAAPLRVGGRLGPYAIEVDEVLRTRSGGPVPAAAAAVVVGLLALLVLVVVLLAG